MRKFAILGLLISFVLVLFSPLASSFPDGLERVSENFNFAEMGKTLVNSPIPDYSLPQIKSSSFSTILAGIIGTLIVFILLFIIERLLFKKSKI